MLDPALDHFGIGGRTTGDILEAGSIHADMFRLLLTADLILADVSIDNANVYYELGIRHALREKRTVLLRTSADPFPFDLKGVRYHAYDRSDPGASLEQFKEVLHATLHQTQQDSPVFRYLPELREPPRSRFLAVPSDFRDEVQLARDLGFPGDLDLLATEVRGFEWAEEGLRLVGRGQFALKAHQSARRTWEAVRRHDEQDKEANTLLGTVYQRLGDLPRSELAVQRVLGLAETSPLKRAEAYSLLGRNAKARWRAEWDGLPTEERAPRALRSGWLEKSFELYGRGFREDLNHFYSGLNAVAMLTLLTDLAAAIPHVWEERADTEQEAESLLAERRAELARLTTAVTLSLQAAQERLERTGERDLWVQISDADLFFLTSTRAPRVAHRYGEALLGSNAFDQDAVRQQLVIFRDLALRSECVEAALAVMKLEPPRTEQPHVLLFTGHRVDPPGRGTPRFPADREEIAHDAIREVVAEELGRSGSGALGIAGGASGGDILFHEICGELGIPTTLYLGMERRRYLAKSVEDGGPEWVRRFDELYAQLPRRELTTDGELPRWLSARHKEYSIWQRTNLWMLFNALARDRSHGPHVTLIALWNGREGDGPGGTKDMVEQAREHGARVIVIDTEELFGLG